MTIADIVSNLIFLIMGMFGIVVQLKGLNYLLLVGSVGIIIVVLTNYIGNTNRTVPTKK